MTRVLVVDNYDSFTWNLVHYLQDEGGEIDVIRNDDMSAEAALARGADGVVLSPGPCTPAEAGICVELIRSAGDDLPVLGVCLGHQAIGQAFGGVVEAAREIVHGKRSEIRHGGGELFRDVPQRFEAVRYHSLAVRRDGLPDVLRIDAESADGEIMALSHVGRPVFGVQFHPESIGSEHGRTILRNFLRLARRR
jgi:anthranilate synthase component 2